MATQKRPLRALLGQALNWFRCQSPLFKSGSGENHRSSLLALATTGQGEARTARGGNLLRAVSFCGSGSAADKPCLSPTAPVRPAVLSLLLLNFADGPAAGCAAYFLMP